MIHVAKRISWWMHHWTNCVVLHFRIGRELFSKLRQVLFQEIDIFLLLDLGLYDLLLLVLAVLVSVKAAVHVVHSWTSQVLVSHFVLNDFASLSKAGYKRKRDHLSSEWTIIRKDANIENGSKFTCTRNEHSIIAKVQIDPSLEHPHVFARVPCDWGCNPSGPTSRYRRPCQQSHDGIVRTRYSIRYTCHKLNPSVFQPTLATFRSSMRSALVTAGSAIAEKSADTGGCMWFLFLV